MLSLHPQDTDVFFEPTAFEPTGFAGRLRSRIVLDALESDPATDAFVPIEDRWRIGFPPYDRLGRRRRLDAVTMSAVSGNYQYVKGHWYDPYNQNVLKGDYPIIGQNTFLNLTFTSDISYESRNLPTPSGESTERTSSREFFGRSGQNFVNSNFIMRADLFHGDSAFKPFDWRLRLSPVFNWNYLDVEELGVVNIDVSKGIFREWRDFALQEAFFEVRLADLGEYYDFVNLRIGRQPFISDFRGFVFNEVNQGVRLFGNQDSNRRQWNVVYFYQAEKDTNSDLNTFDARDQQVIVANYYVQDSLDFEFVPESWRKGYTTQFSIHYNHDDQGTQELHFDRNGFLVRPDPVGSFTPHDVKVAYLGWTGDGHVGRLNVDHAFYWALGRDDLNPIAGQKLTVNAQMAAIESSLDIDWIRLRSSLFWASGDRSPQDREGRGFDAIFDNPNFAGGPFSFWNREAIRLLGVNLTNRNSLLPDLSSSKTEGQASFVNPGLFLINAGLDAEITPKLKAITNASYLWFAHTETLELFLKQPAIPREIGLDVGFGLQYRPYLNNNLIMSIGVSALRPGDGLSETLDSDEVLYAFFTNVTFTF
ncbi:MAG: hypothetical protein AABZ47_02860 [Planctomycetota bacterium]|mgnify:CR=1 FL=1